jgi:hypothetical protein
MEFTFLPAQVKPHLETFLEGVIERRSRWSLTGTPERSDTDRGCMPAEAGSRADGRFLQGVFEQFADGHGDP